MEFVPIPNCIKLDLVQTLNGQVVTNTLHFGKDTAFSLEDITNTVMAVESWWDTELSAALSNDLSLIMIRATDQSSQTGLGMEVAIGGPKTGKVVSPSVPNNVCIAVKLVTSIRGRSHRGRFYVPGLVKAQVTGNDLLGTTVSELKEYFENLITTQITGGAKLVIASRFTNKAPRVTGTYTDVTGAFVESTVDSQRRRLPGRGQ